MNRGVRVDVIVPCYNYGGYLELCVSSILRQPAVDVRVLIIDDASSDSTPVVAARLAAADSRVTYRRHEKNAGHIATYNEGLAWAAGDYVLLISADDLLTEGALARATRALESHPEAVMAHGRQIMFDQEPRAPLNDTFPLDCPFQICSGIEFIGELCAQGHNPVATPTAVVRTSVHKRIGDYDRSLPHTADLHVWLRVAGCGHVIALQASQAFKRRHARNMQIQFVAAPEGDVIERSQAFEGFFSGAGAQLPQVTALLKTAHQALASDLFWRAASTFEAHDDEQCRRLLQLSRQTFPEIVRTTSWRRLWIKRKIGSRLWSRISGLSNAVRA
jgi:hypothetical protein